MLPIRIIRLGLALVFLIITIIVLSIFGYKGGFSIEKINLLFSFLLFLTFGSATPSIITVLVDKMEKPSHIDRYILGLLIIPMIIASHYSSPFISVLIFIALWFFLAIKVMSLQKKILVINLIIFMIFCFSNIYINSLSVEGTGFAKIYSRFLLSSYFLALCIFGLSFFKKKVVQTLGPVVLLSAGQLIISLFDIFSFVSK